mmetsp:Transcript_2469/g.6722  ORF Transcript_2469/g.6722 Transcript_2469/m.6722 type:complete len:118 (-) Transcript_2469:489-842(-)
MIRFREVCVVLLVAVGTVHGAPIFKGAQDISATHRPLSNPNCSGTEQCPFWPTEFQAPFGLNSFLPYINNASSFFYYKYTDDVQAQLVDYSEQCAPFTSVSSFFASRYPTLVLLAQK